MTDKTGHFLLYSSLHYEVEMMPHDQRRRGLMLDKFQAAADAIRDHAEQDNISAIREITKRYRRYKVLYLCETEQRLRHFMERELQKCNRMNIPYAVYHRSFHKISVMEFHIDHEYIATRNAQQEFAP